MRGATPNGIDGFYQFFGIPDALGRGQTYGIKQGWMCCQEGQRRLHTTGILGPDARFAVAFTSQYSSSQSYEHGAQTLTAAVRTVFPDGVPPSGSTRNPVGALEAAGPTTPGTVGVRGWAYDPDSPTANLDVHVYVDGTGAAIARADGSRPDVGAAFPGPVPGTGTPSTSRLPVVRTRCAPTRSTSAPGRPTRSSGAAPSWCGPGRSGPSTPSA